MQCVSFPRAQQRNEKEALTVLGGDSSSVSGRRMVSSPPLRSVLSDAARVAHGRRRKHRADAAPPSLIQLLHHSSSMLLNASSARSTSATVHTHHLRRSRYPCDEGGRGLEEGGRGPRSCLRFLVVVVRILCNSHSVLVSSARMFPLLLAVCRLASACFDEAVAKVRSVRTSSIPCVCLTTTANTISPPSRSDQTPPYLRLHPCVTSESECGVRVCSRSWFRGVDRVCPAVQCVMRFQE